MTGIGMRRAGPVVAGWVLAAACQGGSGPAVIGYAFETSGGPSVAVAREAVAPWSPAAPGIAFIFDSVQGGEPADIEIERAQRFVAIPGLVGVVGHAGSRGSLAAAPIYNEAEVPHIVPTGTSRLLRNAGPWTFALPPDDSIEGNFIAAFVVDVLGARRISVFYANDEYGVGMLEGVRAGLARRGAMVMDQVPFGPGSDVTVLVEASLARGRPDAVVSAGRWAETAALTRLMAAHVPGVRVVAGDGAMYLPRLADAVGPAADALYVVDFWVPNGTPESRDFVERFRRLAGFEPVGVHAMSHDALMLLAHAVREVGPRREAIRDYLRSLGRERPAYQGITGPISFHAGRPTNLVMARLVDGVRVRVEAP